MKKFIVSLMSVLLLVSSVMVGLPSGVANASEVESDELRIVTGDIEKELWEKSKEELSDQVLNKLEINDLELELETTQVFVTKDNQFFAQFHVNDSSKLDKFSNATILFDENKEFVSLTEYSLEIFDEENAKFYMYENGIEIYDEDIYTGEDMVELKGFSLKKLQDCLSGLNVTKTVIALVAIVCGGVCLITGPGGCLTCLMVEASLAGSGISVCVKKAFA